MNDIYNLMLKKQEFLNNEIHKIQAQSDPLLNDPFLCERNGKYYKWKKKLDGKWTYVKKSERQEAQQLAYNKYLKLLLSNLEDELHAVNMYLKNHPSEDDALNLLQSNGYYELIQPVINPHPDEKSEWANQDYKKNTYRTDELIYRSEAGSLHRSKSETMIASALFRAGLPFRYECAFTLQNGKTIYPDFSIIHPETKELILWEHMGMMDNPNYRKDAMRRLSLLADSGYFINHNLIITIESDTIHFDAFKINKIIEEYFLIR